MQPSSRILDFIQLVVLHLIPLYGVIFLHWDTRLLICTYFIETVLIVIFHAIRLQIVQYRYGHLAETAAKSKKLAESHGSTTMPSQFIPIFSLIVFGFFCFVQILIMGGFASEAFRPHVFAAMYQAARGPLFWVLISFAVLQLQQLIAELISEKYAGTPVEELFFKPFRRIFVQQLTVILGGFFMLFGAHQWYLILLVLINLAVDLFAFFIENKRLRSALTHNDAKAEAQYDELKKMM
jgi:hypothetical protein